MIKKMVYLDSDQDRIVKRLARKGKTSETEVIRRAIDAYGRADAAKVASDTRRVVEYVKAHPKGWADEPSEFFHG
ncbi:MAG: CopG family transcriptional regulator [Candidatus Tyrphobacter sp.]